MGDTRFKQGSLPPDGQPLADVQRERNQTPERLTSNIVQQFTSEGLTSPRVWAFACAMAMQLFLTRAKVSEEERKEFLETIVLDLGQNPATV